MRRFNFSRLLEERGDHVPRGVGVVVVGSASLGLSMLAYILSYCVVVVTASCSMVVLLPVSVAARTPKFPSNCFIKDTVVPWWPAVPYMEEGAVPLVYTAEATVPNTLPRPVDTIVLCLRDWWRGTKNFCQDFHVCLSGSLPYHLG